MRKTLILAATLFVATSALAVTPQFWRVRSAEDFLAGELEGVAINSRGELRPAPAATKVATFTDPFVLSQADAPNGDRFLGTGNDGKLYRLRGSDTKVIFTAPEPQIYAVVYRDGALYAGSSPNGKIYRVDPESGKSTVFYDPQQAYIWSIAVSGNDLIVGTGTDGKLLRVDGNGQGKVLFDSPDTHIRSVAVKKDGTILAGGSSKGRIYEVNASGSARALYESALNEITAIWIDPAGVAWAAGVSNVLPATAPAKAAQKPAQQGGTSASASGGEAKKDDSSGTAEVTFSFDDNSGGAAASPTTGTAEVYRINADGFVEVVRKFEREMIYALGPGPTGGVLVATGPSGRIYEMKAGEVALIATVPEKQIVSVSRQGDTTFVTTTNNGAVYRLAGAAKGTFTSVVKDTERFSNFGSYRVEGSGLANGVSLTFRSGNTKTPDETWSTWSAPQAGTSGQVAAPAARYLQWKLALASPAASATVDAVEVAYVNRNVAPTIDALYVQDPGVVFISAAYPASPQLVEATNPDENGIFQSLDTPKDRSGDPGKRAYRKGYRTISWRAHDDNGDALRYSLAFRPSGSDKWLRFRDNMDETMVNFDTSQLPDGLYQIRLTATDVTDNPNDAQTDVRQDMEFRVDNTPPAITSTADGGSITIRVTDSASPIGKLEYAVDADKWIRLAPADGISDSTEETYRLDRSLATGKFLVVRAVDGFSNVTTKTIAVQ